MSKDYIGKKRKSGGIFGLIMFCMAAFAITFVISYVVNNRNNINIENNPNVLEKEAENKFEKEMDELFADKNNMKKETVKEKEENNKSDIREEKKDNYVAVYNEPEIDTETDIAVSSTPEKAIVPIENGSFIKEFSLEAEYSAFYEDWRTHTGIDISGKEGENVRVIADGVVVEAYIDPASSGTLKVDHGSFFSVYMGLNPEEMEMTGTVLKKGDTIGKLEGKILGESSKTHLHFEIIENDVYTDPMKYLG